MVLEAGECPKGPGSVAWGVAALHLPPKRHYNHRRVDSQTDGIDKKLRDFVLSFFSAWCG